MKFQKGVTLLEMLVALSIMAAIAAGVTALIDQSAKDTKAAVTATHVRAVGEAANKYIRDNYSGLTGSATATTPALIRISDLIAGGYLTTGFSTTNPRRQSTCVLVLEPTSNNLVSLLVTEGGDTIDDLTLGQIASMVGGAGGGVYSTDTTKVRGAMGGYSLAIGNFANANHLGQKCDGTGGTISFAKGHPMMALWFADGAAVSATLYRNSVPGNPSLNTMNTPILMGASTVQTAGNACTSTGAIGRDANGAVLSCVSGTWKSAASAYWGDPVANFASLPACNAATANQTRVVATPSVGSGRRAYTCNGGGTWDPLGTDNNGNITIAGRLTANDTLANEHYANGWFRSLGDGGWYNQKWNGGWYMSDGTWVRSYADKNVYTGGQMYAGSMRSIGRMTADEYVQVNGVATENAGCSPNGLVARDSVGLLLSCQSGIWKKASGSDSGFYSGGYGGYRKSNGTCSNACLKANPKTGGCSCPAGSSAFLVTSVPTGCSWPTTQDTYSCE